MAVAHRVRLLEPNMRNSKTNELWMLCCICDDNNELTGQRDNDTGHNIYGRLERDLPIFTTGNGIFLTVGKPTGKMIKP